MTPDLKLRVFIVDDDGAVRDSLSLMLGLLGYETMTFSSAEDFLESFDPNWLGCVIADLRLPGKSGLELQLEVRARGWGLPFIMLTGHGDVPSARAAFQADAIDFLEKPVEEIPLRNAIAAALELELSRARRESEEARDAALLETLTPREREVLVHVSRGLPAKEISVLLGISPRTVEVHKARIMEKLGARNVAELVRIAVTIERSAVVRREVTPTDS